MSGRPGRLGLSRYGEAAVAVEREGWDWLLYAVSLAAAGVTIVAFVADAGLNSTGRRWLPSLLPPAASVGARVASPWPPPTAAAVT